MHFEKIYLQINKIFFISSLNPENKLSDFLNIYLQLKYKQLERVYFITEGESQGQFLPTSPYTSHRVI